MQERARRCLVTVRPGGTGTPEQRVVYAETPALAAGLAESYDPPGRATLVHVEYVFIGRCAKCGSFIEAKDRHQKTRDAFRCLDCL